MNGKEKLKFTSGLIIGCLMSVLIWIIILALGILISSSVDVEACTVTDKAFGFSESFDKWVETTNTDELDVLANVIYYENYSNGYDAMLYTGSVVLNRVKCSWYPDNIIDVVYQPHMYATTKFFGLEDVPNEVRDIARKLIMFGSFAPDNVLFQSKYSHLGCGYWKIINGEYFSFGY